VEITPHISETNRVTNAARKLKFGTLVGIMRTSGYIKICLLGVSGEIRSSHFLFWDTPHISEANRARKLKFGMLVGICRYYGCL